MPHSEISGSMRACRYPKLIAAYHVLRRLPVPRHPLCALIRLTKNWSCPARHARHAANRSQRVACNPPKAGLQATILLTRLYAVFKEQMFSCVRRRDTRRRTQRNMVGVPGIEPGTSSLSGTRSNQLSYTPVKLPCPPSPRLRRGTPRRIAAKSGGNRVRTGDLMLAKHVLYQLSYAPRMAPRSTNLPSLLRNAPARSTACSAVGGLQAG